MKNSRLLSGLLLGLSTFLLSAQPQMRTGVSLGVEVNSGPSTTPPVSASAVETEEEKPDINEIINTSTEFTNSVGMVMKKAGGVWVSAYETAQKEYQEVTGSNPSGFRGENRPVDSVSWEAAYAFCVKLNEHEKSNDMLPDGYQYALPTQTQWETLAAGVPLANAVTSSGTRRSGTAEVGSLKPTGAGLYDLRGNVMEWCTDRSTFPSDGTYRTLRGGSWADWIEINLRPEFAVMVPPEEAQNTYGFRCVLVKGL